ncbi:MAG: hypothetical protein LBM04_08945 [Opitutaceae bacterium]|jgi:hypothetical protein|nr:hypothetical protein [Opitutaceae bacterium]
MKRHVLPALFRVILGICLIYAPPLSHMEWGREYPGDGQQAFGIIIMLFFIGSVVAAIFIIMGTLGQILLRRKPASFTICMDLTLFVLIAGVLSILGITAEYRDRQQNESDAAQSQTGVYSRPFAFMPDHSFRP